MTRLLACPAQEQVKRGLRRGGGCGGRLSGTGVGKTACLQDDDPMQMLNKGGKCYEEIFESSGGNVHGGGARLFAAIGFHGRRMEAGQ